MSASHFTATVEVTKTTHKPAATNGRGYVESGAQPAREVVDVARIVVRAATLDALREKVAGHVALLDDNLPRYPHLRERSRLRQRMHPFGFVLSALGLALSEAREDWWRARKTVGDPPNSTRHSSASSASTSSTKAEERPAGSTSVESLASPRSNGPTTNAAEILPHMGARRSQRIADTLGVARFRKEVTPPSSVAGPAVTRPAGIAKPTTAA